MNKSIERHEFSLNSLWEDIKQSVDPEFEKVYVGLLAGILTACCVAGLTFNITALCFFSNRSTNFRFKVMFRAAACIDVLISFLAIFVAASFFEVRQPAAFANEGFCQVWGFLWSFVAKLSANIVSISSLMRMFNIFSPSSYFLKAFWLQVITVLDATIIILLESLLFVFEDRPYRYVGAMGGCVPADATIANMGPLSLRSAIVSYVPLLIYLLPFPIILCCYLISSYKLIQQKKRSASGRLQGGKRFHAQAIITLSSFMALYLFLQAPLAAYFLWARIRIFSGSTVEDIFEPSWNLPYLPGMVYLLTISLNALLNPIVYYLRIQGFRNFVRNIFLDLSRGNAADLVVENRDNAAAPTVDPVLGDANGTESQQPMVTCGVIRVHYNVLEEETYYETCV